MSNQKAIIIKGPKDARLVSDHSRPKLRDDYILIKTVAVALNPTDWKHIDFLATKGVLVGCDYSGIVEEVGKAVKKPFKKGDRICGMCHGSNQVELEDGSFAENIVAKGDVQMHVPEHMSFEEAATLGVGILTIGQALYQSLKLPLPTEPVKEAFPVLIYGGSTATGTLAIQSAKLSGLTVYSTCSPHNFDLVKRLGADVVLDYKDSDCGNKFRKQTDDKLKHALDTISEGSSPTICADALSSSGGTYSALLTIKDFPRDDVEVFRTLAYSAIGEPMKFGPGASEIPGKPEDFKFAVMWMDLAEKLLMDGKLTAHTPSFRPGGLKGVLEGLDLLRNGKVSGEKLVYRIADTP